MECALILFRLIYLLADEIARAYGCWRVVMKVMIREGEGLLLVLWRWRMGGGGGAGGVA